jgi:hypothetical protein
MTLRSLNLFREGTLIDKRKIRPVCCIILMVAACIGTARAEVPERLPADLELREEKPQRYRVRTVWHNRDAEGTATGKYVISGVYTRGLEDNMVRWNDVWIAVFSDPEGMDADTLYQDSMENLSYRSPDDIASPMLFARLPADQTRHLLSTLIWDAIGIEIFAWEWFEKLELNEPYRPADFEDFVVKMESWGTLKMRGLQLRWAGESVMNGRKCAVINYHSFANPVRSIGMNGRSLYWGTILVSLEDKQIEHGTLNEDVLIKRPASGSGEGVLNIQRGFTFARAER